MAIEVMIEFGRFPSNKREVLISHELLQEKYKVKDNFKVWVGKKIVFKGEEYTISGILYSIKDSSVSGNKNGNFDSYINEDVYYFGWSWDGMHIAVILYVLSVDALVAWYRNKRVEDGV